MIVRYMIKWPDRYAPDRTRIHVRNEKEMDVKPELVWGWLVRAQLWPTWYSNSADVTIEGGGPDLKAGSVFRWKTFGISLNSKVEEFVPFERLAWSAKGTGIDAYHAWLIEPIPTGCHVTTEENQNGWLAAIGHTLRPGNTSNKHQDWLDSMLSKARAGPPPDAV
jgi:hypothetical protein